MQVVTLSQTLLQLKFDWLREHIQYEVEDHARNPILLSRSLTERLGPRIAFALHKGFVGEPRCRGFGTMGRRRNVFTVYLPSLLLMEFVKANG